MAVVKALATTHASVTAYTTMAKCSYHDVDDHIFAVIISGMISLRLGFNKVEVPDMPGEISDILCSICREMMDYNSHTVNKYIDHYITNGTSGLDDRMNSGDSDDSDDTYKFFLLFMDIKSVVYAWITAVIALPPKKRKKLDQWRKHL
tara:strand:- start:1706 stop:2149 length:444 start_codon:yes stop_codon:yes gene_type:complete